MGKVILYIATSIDGFIARKDGNLDWLTSFPPPENGDYGYSELLKNTGSIIMGRKTYTELLGFGIEWPYNGFKCYILTRNNAFDIQSPETYVITGIQKEIIEKLKTEYDKDIWLVGGGEIVSAFINNGLIDRMIIAVIPVILGEGIPLFQSLSSESMWKLIKSEAFNTGAVILTYDRE